MVSLPFYTRGSADNGVTSVLHTRPFGQWRHFRSTHTAVRTMATLPFYTHGSDDNGVLFFQTLESENRPGTARPSGFNSRLQRPIAATVTPLTGKPQEREDSSPDLASTN